ncbi:ATP-binding cassette domain-containing protein [Microbulbifer sp. SAOS-129_SWC]|uniref:ABC transporter ATP-binding protein n=1 Tax=Microbulbifer sp. SAOS-129_SWC TaxID=3145235 RepID=UPI0032162760
MTTLKLQGIAAGALAPLDLTVAPGEIVCLSGPSGCGKSRLLRAIADLDPHRGSVRLGDREQGQVPAHQWRRAVMLVPAESAWWYETVGAHFENEPQALLEPLGFSADVAQWPVARLSSGEKQRLALARALDRKPQALLLDEPTANLDEDNILKVEGWLQNIIHEQQLPTLWVAHQREQIRRVAGRHLHIAGDRLQSREIAR